jgi:branched-chain amino acid aminotransferase
MQDAEVMGEPLVFVNGDFVPQSEATISVFDRGLRVGDTVYEVERTFGGKLFELERHIDRLFRALKYVRIDIGMDPNAFGSIVEDLVSRNAEHHSGHDVTAVQIVTRGAFDVSFDVLGVRGRPTVIVYTQEIDPGSIAHFYVRGKRAMVPSVRRIPPQSLSPKVKIANKMGHTIAWLEAQAMDPGSVALMLDLDGRVTGIAPGANLLFFANGEICAPNPQSTLDSTSAAMVSRLAGEIGVHTRTGDFSLFDLMQADEVFQVDTRDCVTPIVSVNGAPIGNGKPGSLHRSLLKAWSEVVGLNILETAIDLAPDKERAALRAELAEEARSPKDGAGQRPN